ncbi:substrate-binding domain-containing protein [Alkalimonas collagenimarina]|uniref:Substrate-binding domain-containing protein n=1 Tax=Alkalimonas collagenimarina TaxID=400390 RepID=A0ABT9GWL7_9GAMM|nr:substrate-binding domain-containing protein [Alkalimonas collagenimarina]MDP4535456.1 substrate-binding domain-containing protein [Alkalimonas collagenimarina]
MAQPLWAENRDLTGNLISSGSDSLNTLMRAWAVLFKQDNPEINIQIHAGGSSTAAVALAQSTAHLGPMSRTMNPAERRRFEQLHGYTPTAIPVAIEALAVFVHRHNPLNTIAWQQLEPLFSAEPLCSEQEKIRYWHQLGVRGDLGARLITSYGRNTASGTYGFLKSHLLCGADFRADLHELPGAAAVIQAVALSPSGIGIAGKQHATASVKELPFNGEQTAAESGLQRMLYVYVNSHPEHGIAAKEQAFLRMILSEPGQQLVAQYGYVPLPAEQRKLALGALDGP